MTDESFKIDFIGIGAPKSGTTWISQCLDEHPDICHSHRFETVFFENTNFYRKGLAYYGKFFAHYKLGQKRGEITPTYLYSAETAQRIKEAFPQVKLIVCLRNPIERAHSHYTAHERHGKNIIWLKSFDEIRGNQGNPYFKRGLYYESLQWYITIFGRENILILIHDDIKTDPRQFMQKIYSFLGVNPDFVPPSLLKRINAAEERGVYSKSINQWLLYGKLGKALSRLPFYKQLRRLLIWTRIFKYTRKAIGLLNKRNKAWVRSPMSQETREFLKRAYQKDIANLETLLNRKLDFWK